MKSAEKDLRKHRHEALRKMQAAEAYAIIWTSSVEEYNDLLREKRIKILERF